MRPWAQFLPRSKLPPTKPTAHSADDHSDSAPMLPPHAIRGHTCCQRPQVSAAPSRSAAGSAQQDGPSSAISSDWGDLVTSPTTVAMVSPHTAASAGLKAGDAVLVTGSSR